MKKCPVCNTSVKDHFTGFCPNTDCTWEFEFISEMTPELKEKYEEKLKRAKAAYARFINTDNSSMPTNLNDVDTIGARPLFLAVDGSNKWDFIDKLGNEAIPLKYDHANSFYKDLARVEQEVFVKVFPTPIIESLKVPMPDFESRFKLNSIVLNSPNIDLSIKLPDFNLSVPEYVTQKIPINKIKPKYNLKTSIFNFSKLYERIRRKTKT